MNRIRAWTLGFLIATMAMNQSAWAQSICGGYFSGTADLCASDGKVPPAELPSSTLQLPGASVSVDPGATATVPIADICTNAAGGCPILCPDGKICPSQLPPPTTITSSSTATGGGTTAILYGNLGIEYVYSSTDTVTNTNSTTESSTSTHQAASAPVEASPTIIDVATMSVGPSSGLAVQETLGTNTPGTTARVGMNALISAPGLIPWTADGQPGGVCPLDGSSQVSISYIPVGTGTDTTHVVGTSDPRLSDPRTPTGNISVGPYLTIGPATGTATATTTSLASGPIIKAPGLMPTASATNFMAATVTHVLGDMPTASATAFLPATTTHLSGDIGTSSISGSNVTVDVSGGAITGTHPAASTYTLPAATTSVRGGVEIGAGVTITGDVISVTPAGIGALPATDPSVTNARTPTGNIQSVSPVYLTSGTSTATATSLGLSSTPVVHVDVSGLMSKAQNVSCVGCTYVVLTGTGTNTSTWTATTTSTSTNVGAITGIIATGAGYTLPIASSSTLGGVKIGSGITEGTDGTISVSTAGMGAMPSPMPVVCPTNATCAGKTATDTTTSTATGTGTFYATAAQPVSATVASTYTLPIAGTTTTTGTNTATLGGMKAGQGLHRADDGTISVPPISSSDVTGALGFTPGTLSGNGVNCSGNYIVHSNGLASTCYNYSYLSGNGVSSSRQLVDASNGLVTGAHTMASSDVTTALGYTPPSGSGSTGGLAYWASPTQLGATAGISAAPTPNVAVVSDSAGKVDSWVTGSTQKGAYTYTDGGFSTAGGAGYWRNLVSHTLTLAGGSIVRIHTEAIFANTNAGAITCGLAIMADHGSTASTLRGPGGWLNASAPNSGLGTVVSGYYLDGSASTDALVVLSAGTTTIAVALFAIPGGYDCYVPNGLLTTIVQVY